MNRLRTRLLSFEHFAGWASVAWNEEMPGSLCRERVVAREAIAALKAGEGYHGDLVRLGDDGRPHIDELIALPVPGGPPGSPQVLVTRRDVSAERRQDAWARLRGETLARIAANEPLASALASIVEGVETVLPGTVCGITLLQPDRRRLGETVGPHLPPALGAQLAGLPVGRPGSTVATVAFGGSRAVCADLASDPGWEGLQTTLAQAGLSSGWLSPVPSVEGTVLGVFAAYQQRPALPEPTDEVILEQAARLAGVAVEHARHAELIAEKESQLRALLESVPVPLRMVDLRTKAPVFCNQACAELFEFDMADFLSMDPRASYRRWEDGEEVISRGASGDFLRMHPFEMVTARGKPLAVLVSYTRVDFQGRPCGLAWFSDVTDLERARRAAEDNARFQATFLANMSHEIRTPMNAIIGLTDLALRTALTGQQQDYLGKVHAAARSLLGILNDILDLTKIESGRLRLEAIEFSLDEVLDNLATVLAVPVEEKSLELLFARADDVPRRLLGDPLRLTQVLTNLAGNACKFTESGEVVVSVEVTGRDPGLVDLRLQVRDTGIGMNPAQVARLFQPFSQADDTVARRFGGTGLGLAISRQLVELMGGRIAIDSAEGAGTTVTVDLPMRLPAGGQDAGDHPRRPDLAGLPGARVLVVDDNARARELLHQMARQLGFRVDTADDGAQALAHVRAADAHDPFALVVMDERMPVLDGLEASRQLRADSGLRAPPRLVLLTGGNRPAAQEAQARGVVDALVAKPVSASALVDAALSAFGQERARAPRRTATTDPEPLRRLRSSRVLVVEDNAINRQVATELLEQAGVVCEVAVNGRDALARLEVADFDCVLMDVQMPVMDGYTATERIRQHWRWADLPVIAMTANVMAEDRRRAEAVGMNDHVAKPIVPSALFAALLRWVRPRAGAPGAEAPSGGMVASEGAAAPALPPQLPGLDLAEAQVRLGGKEGLLRRLLASFPDEHGDDAARLRDALAGGRTHEAARIAHTLKSVADTLGAAPLRKVCARLESDLRQGDPRQCVAAAQALEHELALVLQGLRVWREFAPPPVPARGDMGDPEGADPDHVRARCAHLAGLLRDMDPEAGAEAEALAGLLGDRHPEALQMSAHAARFDFGPALEALEALQAALP